jgi:chromosomal replication initiation ATPase DnaA
MRDRRTALVKFDAAVLALQAAARELRLTMAPMARSVGGPAHPRDDLKMIQTVVSDHYGLHVVMMTNYGRSLHIVQPRQVAMVLCRELTKHTLQVIGQVFQRDHNTIIHATRVIGNRLQTEDGFAVEFESVRKKVRAALKAIQ